MPGRKLLKIRFATSTMALSTIALLPLLVSSAALVSCNSGDTEDPHSNIVKLRNDLRGIATGALQEIRGQTLPEESYVLLYGYQVRGSLHYLPISETLQDKLEALTPYDYERYVLVHVVGNKIKEYTRWEPGHDPVFRRVPFLIDGDPFIITVEAREPHLVTIRLQ